MKSKDWRPTAFVETAPGGDTEEAAEASPVAPRRSLLALLRQLVTLDALALLLSVTFLARAFAQPVQRDAVALAIGAFLLSLVGAGIALLSGTLQSVRVGSPHDASRGGARAHAGAALAAFVVFAFGLGALAWFFFANWFR
jgi:hypothetical protein